jgi:putative transposase
MARIARAAAPGLPHPITQRGNRKQPTFFCEDDYGAYIGMMAQWCPRCGVEVWAYYLMPNPVHRVAVPKSEDGLRRALGEAHRRYTRLINFREGWRGHLGQGRFSSFVMDESYLLAAARYVELNPVRARLVEKLERYPWSSAAAHVKGVDDALVKVAPLRGRVNEWRAWLQAGLREQEAVLIRRHERTGRPLGEAGLVPGWRVGLGGCFTPSSGDGSGKKNRYDVP